MANEVFDFRWRVPEDGFKWVEARVYVNEGGADPRRLRHDSRLEEKPQWVLSDGVAVGTRYVVRQYNPLRMFTGLFRTFAAVDPTREAILTFANTYGDLGIARPLDVRSPSDHRQLYFVRGETLADWVTEIDAMRQAVAIWDMVRARDVPGLSRHIRWDQGNGGPNWVYDSHPELPPFHVDPRRAVPAGAGRHTDLILPVPDLFKPGDVLMPATFLVQNWINTHLMRRVSPRVVYDLDRGAQALRFYPESLLGALWLQFAQAIDGDKEYRACRECGKWFEVSLDAFRTNRVFCSDPCKSRDYRRRKDRARQLRAEGRSAKEIAKELDTELETVKKWVAKRKG
jgi:hypothetical protein